MKRIFVDSNIFIRFLIGDNKKMAEEARDLFESVEKGKIKAETNLINLAEIIWTLSSYFEVSKVRLVEYINLLLDLKNLIIKDREVVIKALELYKNFSIDFIDAFCASWVLRRKIKYICSYDTDFDKIKGIKRIEPAKLK